MPIAETGSLMELAWGQYRLSAIATARGMMPRRQVIDIPPTMTQNVRTQTVGSTIIDDLSVQVTRDDLEATLKTAWDDETALDLVAWERGTAGNGGDLVENVRLAQETRTHAPDTWLSQDYTMAAGDDSQFRKGAQVLLFDHNIAHLSGVSAPVTGAIVEVGAVSATQSVKVFFGNLHSPAPTWTGAAMQLESDPIIGFTTANLRGSAVTGMSSTASYELQTIAGPITDTFWRLNITAITTGTGYPVCLMWIVDN